MVQGSGGVRDGICIALAAVCLCLMKLLIKKDTLMAEMVCGECMLHGLLTLSIY